MYIGKTLTFSPSYMRYGEFEKTNEIGLFTVKLALIGYEPSRGSCAKGG